MGNLTSTEFPVSLHVYDLGPLSRWAINSWASTAGELGMYHCGIEVLGIELCFQAVQGVPKEDASVSGVTWHFPKAHPQHTYRESVELGNCPLPALEIQQILKDFEKAWSANTYNCLSKNCVDFAQDLASALHTPRPFPTWVHGLAKNVARNPYLQRLHPHISSWCASIDSRSIDYLPATAGIQRKRVLRQRAAPDGGVQVVEEEADLEPGEEEVPSRSVPVTLVIPEARDARAGY